MDMWIKGPTKHGEYYLERSDKKHLDSYKQLPPTPNNSHLAHIPTMPTTNGKDFTLASLTRQGMPSLDSTHKPLQNLWQE